jgi:hypothetical protein
VDGKLQTRSHTYWEQSLKMPSPGCGSGNVANGPAAPAMTIPARTWRPCPAKSKDFRSYSRAPGVAASTSQKHETEERAPCMIRVIPRPTSTLPSNQIQRRYAQPPSPSSQLAPPPAPDGSLFSLQHETSRWVQCPQLLPRLLSLSKHWPNPYVTLLTGPGPVRNHPLARRSSLL